MARVVPEGEDGGSPFVGEKGEGAGGEEEEFPFTRGEV